jgi:hypothetical protein
MKMLGGCCFFLEQFLLGGQFIPRWFFRSPGSGGSSQLCYHFEKGKKSSGVIFGRNWPCRGSWAIPGHCISQPKDAWRWQFKLRRSTYDGFSNLLCLNMYTVQSWTFLHLLTVYICSTTYCLPLPKHRSIHLFTKNSFSHRLLLKVLYCVSLRRKILLTTYKIILLVQS